MRKKARYQELLDREEAYLKMHNLENLKSARKDNILKFISLRRTMLLDRLRHRPASKNAGEDYFPPPLPENESHASGVADIFSQFSELVDDASSFDFDCLLPGGASSDNDEALARMLEWDAALATRLVQVYGNHISDIPSSLTFEIESGANGIAQGNGDLAFCRLDLFLKPLAVDDGNNQADAKLILSGICCFKFGSNSSNRMASMRWSALDDRCFGGGFICPKTGESIEADHSAFDPYKRQMIHPSVVSLDHIRSAEVDETQGPGMTL
jgi:hypothetical protein